MKIRDFDKVRELHNKAYNLEIYLKKIEASKPSEVSAHFNNGHIHAGLTVSCDIKLDEETIKIIQEKVILSLNLQYDDLVRQMTDLGVDFSLQPK